MLAGTLVTMKGTREHSIPATSLCWNTQPTRLHALSRATSPNLTVSFTFMFDSELRQPTLWH